MPMGHRPGRIPSGGPCATPTSRASLQNGKEGHRDRAIMMRVTGWRGTGAAPHPLLPTRRARLPIPICLGRGLTVIVRICDLERALKVVCARVIIPASRGGAARNSGTQQRQRATCSAPATMSGCLPCTCSALDRGCCPRAYACYLRPCLTLTLFGGKGSL